MQQYPSIEKQVIKGQDYYIFDKLDGSNIRVEFSLKKGFDKFGTRKKLMSDDSGILNQSKELIMATEDTVRGIFNKNKWQSGTLFFEFYGPNSFAGFHDEQDAFTVSLIDAHIERKGYLEPRDYLKAFEDKIEMSRLLHVGKLNSHILDEIRNGTFEGMTFEGVIAKAFVKNKHLRCKVKNQQWIDRLKSKYGEESDMFNKLL